MKKWFLERFLPMWAKQTVMADCRRLARQNRLLEQKLQTLEAYVRGLEKGIRLERRETYE